MGIEYKLRFSTVDPEAVAKELRLLPEVREVSQSRHWFDLGCRAPDQDRPQATIEIEPGGVYFCDHCGGQGRMWLDNVVARLVAAFGPVTVEEV